MSTFVTIRVLAVIAVVSACSGGSRDAGPVANRPNGPLSTTVDSSGRYAVVTVSGEPTLGTIDSVTVVRDAFGGVRSVLLDPAGGVWALDERARRVAHYDDTGQRRAVLGKQGSGDGEYATPYSIAWGGGDIMVFDPGNSRVGRWQPDGTWRGAWKAVPITGGSNARFFPSGSSASAWLFQFSFLRTGQPAPAFARFPLTPMGDVRWVPPTVRGGLDNVVICTVGQVQRTFATPFTLGETWQPALGSNLLYVHGVDYAIATVDSAGDTLRVFRRDVAQAPITDAEWAVSGAPLDSFRTANPGSCNGSFTRPRAKAVVRALTLDDRGHVWVERVTGSGFIWEVWEGDRLIGAVPGIDRDADVPIDIRGDRVAFVVREPGGEQVVKVYRYQLPGS